MPATASRSAPTTPGTKVRQLQSELQSKENENEQLRGNVSELVKALGKLELVKPGVTSSAPAEDDKKKSKKTNPVVPAKTAYKFWCEAQPKKEGVNMQVAWKEADPKVRETYTALAKADKARYQSEMEAYEQEQKALEMYREKKKQDEAMAFYEAHLAAQAAIEKAKMEDGKAKKKKVAKDPDAPKRCVSSYMYFAQEMRESVVAKNPEAKVTEISKILGEMWKEADNKSKYEDMAAADRERYTKEKAEYDAMISARKKDEQVAEEARLEQEKKEAMELLESQSVQVQQINVSKNNDNMSVMSDLSGSKIGKKKKDPNAPKRALTAYNYFVSENREDIKKKMPETATNAEIFAEVGKQWKNLTNKKKSKYEKMATKDQQRYAKEMEAYKAKAGSN